MYIYSIAYIYVYRYISHIFFIHSSIDGHLGCFHILAVVNDAAMNIGVHASFGVSVLGFLQIYTRGGIAGSYRETCVFYDGHSNSHESILN